MLSKVQVALIREKIENGYTDKCTIINSKKIRAGSITKFQDEIMASDKPCRLSFQTMNDNTQTDTVSKQEQTIKMFICPEIRVIPGCKIHIEREGHVEYYESAGVPAVYETHQEILLKIAEEYA